jgi:hypothetical protein
MTTHSDHVQGSKTPGTVLGLGMPHSRPGHSGDEETNTCTIL